MGDNSVDGDYDMVTSDGNVSDALSDGIGGSDSDDIAICRNCRRSGPYIAVQQGVDSQSEYLSLYFTEMEHDDIPYARKFCLFKKREVESEGETVTLCAQCCGALLRSTAQSSNKQLSSTWSQSTAVQS